MQPNLISAVLNQTDRDAITAALVVIKGKLPFLLNLSADDRKRPSRVDYDALPFFISVLNFAQQHPECVPGGIDMGEFQKDLALLQAYYPVVQEEEAHHERVMDTWRALIDEVYFTARCVYRTAKAMLPAGQLDANFTAISAFFARTPKPAAPAKNPSNA